MYFLTNSNTSHVAMVEALNTQVGTRDSKVVIIIDDQVDVESITYYDHKIRQLQNEGVLRINTVVYHLNSHSSDFRYYSTAEMSGTYDIISIEILDLEHIKRFVKEQELVTDEELHVIRELQRHL